jgi:hypothetical protein
MKAICSYETPVHLQRTTRRYIFVATVVRTSNHTRSCNYLRSNSSVISCTSGSTLTNLPIIFIYFVTLSVVENIVTYRPIARQRLGKHIPWGGNAATIRRLLLRNESANTPKIILYNRAQCFPLDSPWGYITSSSKVAVSCQEMGRVLKMAVEGDWGEWQEIN